MNNNNNSKHKALPTAAIPLITSPSEKFQELIHMSFEFCAMLFSMPLIILQEAYLAIRNWSSISISNLDSLQGKVVLITGANSGIGESLAKYFYLAGCQLIIAARRKNELERVRDSLTSLPASLKTFVPTVLTLDLADMQSIPEFSKTAISTHGHIDILINNAGIFNQGHVLDTVIQVDEQIMRVNYLGTLSLTKCLAKHMVSRQQGHICLVSSVLGKMSITNSLSYSASKHAMQALADSLRAEIAPEGVHVSIISPSYVNTPISVNAFHSSGEKLGKVTKEIETGYKVEYVSERIFKAVVNKETDVVIAPLLHRGAIYARNFLPAAFHHGISWHGKRFRK